MGSIPYMFVGFIAFLLISLRYASIRFIPLVNESSKKEVSMVKTFTAKTRIFLSSVLETIWALGVSSVAGASLFA